MSEYEDVIFNRILSRIGPNGFGYVAERKYPGFVVTLRQPGVKVTGDPKATLDEAIDSVCDRWLAANASETPQP